MYRPAGVPSAAAAAYQQQQAQQQPQRALNAPSRQGQQQQQQQPSRRTHLYQMYQGGTANRLVLSIRSGIPHEVDYALEALVMTSHSDGAAIPLDTLPGLPGALLDLIMPEPDLETEAEAAGVAPRNRRADLDAESSRRRLEAALVLRNLLLEGGAKAVEAIRPVQHRIFAALVHVLAEQSDEQHEHAASADPLTELALYLLDAAEVYAPRFQLALPGRHSSSASSSLPAVSPAQQLYPLLAQAVLSNDRALIIGAYTLLSALAVNELNEPVFAFRRAAAPPAAQQDTRVHSGILSDRARAQACPTTVLVERALLLSAVNDRALLLPLLEFLYQHTQIPHNAAALLRRRDVRDFLPMLCARVREGSVRESWEYEVLHAYSDGGVSRRGHHLRSDLIATYPVLAAQHHDADAPKRAALAKREREQQGLAKMESADLEKIIQLAEPARALAWMHGVFDLDPAGEMTQVGLWQSYQKQFEPFDAAMKAGSIPSMLNASDVIKHISEAFPTASPKCVEGPDGGKSYIVAGIRPKPPPEVRSEGERKLDERWKCRWSGCAAGQPNFSSPRELHQHLEQHAREGQEMGTEMEMNMDGPRACRFGGCGQQAGTPAALALHIRIHVLPTAPLNSIGPTNMVHAADAQDKHRSAFEQHRTVAQVTGGGGHGNGYATGIGFVASLVLRNLARAVLAAVLRYRKLHASGGEGEGDGEMRTEEGGAGQSRGRFHQYHHDEEQESSRMFGFLSGRGGGGGGGGNAGGAPGAGDEGAAVSREDGDVSKEQLTSALNALVGTEQQVLAYAASNGALAVYLGETLECIDGAKRAAHGLL